MERSQSTGRDSITSQGISVRKGRALRFKLNRDVEALKELCSTVSVIAQYEMMTLSTDAGSINRP
jgi:hypothetical protein